MLEVLFVVFFLLFGPKTALNKIQKKGITVSFLVPLY